MTSSHSTHILIIECYRPFWVILRFLVPILRFQSKFCVFVHHLKQTRPFQCNTCNNSYTPFEHSKQHKMVHTGAKTFLKCNKCDIRFNLFDPSKSHIKIHTGAKPFQCSRCAISFNLFNLSKHQRKIHTRTKPGYFAFLDKTFVFLHLVTWNCTNICKTYQISIFH